MKKYELEYFCEFDKYATQSYCAVHNISQYKNLGDITLVDETNLPPITMIVGGSPCQDFSVAGKQKGSVWTCKDCKHEYNPLTVHWSKRDKCPHCNSDNLEKTRSSLLVEWLRIIRANKPNFGIYENVKNIVGKKFKETTFKMFEDELHEYGYNTYWKLLDAKNYGIPQNRERVYLILIKKELDNGRFKFPKGFDNGIRLKDLLENEVDEKYYISQEKINSIIINNPNKHGNVVKTITKLNSSHPDSNTRRDRVQDNRDICPTITATETGICYIEPIKLESKEEFGRMGKQAVETFNEKQPVYGNTINPFNKTVDNSNNCPTLTTRPEGFKTAILFITYDYRIRKLTPLECWRLMGFSDNSFYKAKDVGISDSQLYKQAGNSIVTNVLFEILVELYKAMPYLFEDLKLGSFFSGIGAFEIALNMLYKYINKTMNDKEKE